MQVSLERAGRAFKELAVKLTPSRRVIQRTGFAAFLAIAGCTPGDAAPNLSKTPNSKTNGHELQLEFPFSDTWYFTGGPHFDATTDGVRSALDFAPPDGRPCPKAPASNYWVEASSSGKVTVVGNEKDTSDKNHSVVKIDHGNSIATGSMHLTDLQVSVGQEVKGGDRLGRPFCGSPPGGKTTGVHLHQFLEVNGKPVDLDGLKISGWTINSTKDNYQGTLTKDGEQIRTAEAGSCGPGKCGDIRNDVSRESNIQITGPQIAAPMPTPNSSFQSMDVIASSIVVPTEVPTSTATATRTNTPVPTSTATSTPRATATSTGTPTRMPTNTPAPTRSPERVTSTPQPNPTSQSLTLEQQAAEVALNSWLTSMANQPPQVFQFFYERVQISFKTDPSELQRWRTNIRNILLSNPRFTDEWTNKPLSIGWSVIEFDPPGAHRAIPKDPYRENGIMEIKNLRVKKAVSRPLSAADRANGLTWDGDVEATFVSRHRAVIERIRNFNPAQARAYLDSPIPTLPTNWSEWEDDGWFASAKKINTWKTNLGVNGGLGLRSPEYRNVLFPSESLARGGFLPKCQDSPTAPCQSITIK